MAFYTYILASGRNGTLYVGSTDDLMRRVSQHKAKVLQGFTADHNVGRLVWYEIHATREDAFAKERRIKKWNRAWKLRMIEAINPDWHDLYDVIRLDGLKDASDWIPPVAGTKGDNSGRD